jgi:hypothetical protein
MEAPFKRVTNGRPGNGTGAEHRNGRGQFTAGNPGGPGRPRRAVEREYLAALGERVPLDAWRGIVDRAVRDAMNGDHLARQWLSKYLLGEKPLSLTTLAADEEAGVGARHDVATEMAWRAKREGAPHESFKQHLADALDQLKADGFDQSEDR